MSLIVCILLLATFPSVLSATANCGSVICEPFGVCVSGVCQCKSDVCKDFEFCAIDKCYCFGATKCGDNEKCTPNGITNRCQAIPTTPPPFRCGNTECQITESCYDNVCLCGGQYCGGLCMGGDCFCGGRKCESDQYCKNSLCVPRGELTTSPPTSTEAPCVDEADDCASNIALCLDWKSESTMRQKCAKTCQFCKCEDTGIISCASSTNLCYDPAHISDMTTNCGKTCKLCPLLCEDSGVVDCAGSTQLCTDSAYREIMGKNCRRTCRFCINNNPCVDKLETCSANQHLCTNAAYASVMSSKCAATCNKC